MICEYCNMYTKKSLKNTKNLLAETKSKFMLKNIESVCINCYNRFHTMQQWKIKNVIVSQNQTKTRNTIKAN